MKFSKLSILAKKMFLPTESFQHRSWISSVPPKKILIIRFHAFGDVIITLPYLQALKYALPHVEIHLLTREECSDIPRHAAMFAKVHALEDRRNAKLLFAKVLALYPYLLQERYDGVIDLQRNTLSRLIRKILLPKCFSEFDRFSLQSAGDRVRHTINALHLTTIQETLPTIELQPALYKDDRWLSVGYSKRKKYIILNPAGSSITKNWPIEHYERFALLWNKTIDADAQFLIIGTERISKKAEYLKRQLGDMVINLVSLTTATEALVLIRNAQFVLSEDSGLMHMAWISQVPLVALFGSTPSVWSRPLGNTSVCLNSSDLECGNCSQPQCKFGDVHCLTRYTPEFVLKTGRQLLAQIESDVRRS